MALLVTLGLNGIFIGLSNDEYLIKDYFQTSQFEFRLNQFTNYLSKIELNAITKEEAKKQITVIPEEVNEHRYRYGDLVEQVANINNQYEVKIQQALISKNKEVADTYIAERNKKIADITNNFKSDEHVRGKIIKEKEQKIDEYFRDLEQQRVEFIKYQGAFKYYLMDKTSRKVFTNLDLPKNGSVDQVFNNKEMVFIQKYPSSNDYLSNEIHYKANNIAINSLFPEKAATIFEGKIAVPKNSLESSILAKEYFDFIKNQRIYYIFTFGGSIALILAFLINKKTAVYQNSYLEKWQPYYNRIPIDLRGLIFLFVGLVTFMFLVMLTNRVTYIPYLDNVYYIRSLVLNILFSSLFVLITMIQGKLFLMRFKDLDSIKSDWQKSLYRGIKSGIKEAFLLRWVGTQIFILMAVVCSFGAGAIIALLKPILIIPYSILFILVGIPVIVFIVKSTGYFNNIASKAKELAHGEFGNDLPVLGNSVLALLADNINHLRHGVKASQKEQIKSERLKTELITNVSHDLRTPLTSIITYTELLKNPELTNEERDTYVQIIDRKSKRLKVLIDDLFEVSKMASGSIELTKEKVDLVQLLQQALAEHNQTISDSTLHFRVTNPDKPVYVLVDGKKIWRVFDNLIGNILKYSLENTRVYISVETHNNKVTISFKNVTKYELSENTDELFERFKRGDTSRHTDGSGLGLAIAKSIVDLHGGNLDIEVDGDLFKVMITL